MGVLPCDRKGCEHIMCDNYVLGNEYRLCWECMGELVSLKDTWEERISEHEMMRRILTFVESPKVCGGSRREDDRDELFGRMTERKDSEFNFDGGW
jgi:hypothetical protein